MSSASLPTEKKKRVLHPNSLANLIPYKKGQSGNSHPPGGYNVSHRLRHMLQEQSDFIPPNANPNDKIYRDQIARTILTEATLGNVPMIRELLDRTEGIVKEEIPPPGPGSQVLNIIVVGGQGNLNDILAQVKERTKKLAIGEG